jgi:hypothetical protein
METLKAILQKPVDWAKAVWTKSWTKLLAWVQVGSAAVIEALGQLNPWISNPTFKSYITDMQLPHSLTLSLGILGIVTWVAHGRE